MQRTQQLILRFFFVTERTVERIQLNAAHA